MPKLLLAEIIVNAVLVGLIWLVQVLVYPSFKYIDEKNYSFFHRFHMKAITPLVGPLMILEAGLSLANLAYQNYPTAINLVGLGLIIIIWLSSFFLSVPTHELLLLKKDDALINKLVRTNWIRTIGWSVKLILLLSLLS